MMETIPVHDVPRPPRLTDAFGPCMVAIWPHSVPVQDEDAERGGFAVAPMLCLACTSCQTKTLVSGPLLETVIREHLLIRAGVPPLHAKHVSQLRDGDPTAVDLAADILARTGATVEDIAAQARAGVWNRPDDQCLWLALGRFW